MLRIKKKFTIMDVSCLMLSLLIVSINIREPFFHTREILFALTIGTSLSFMDLSKLKYAFVLVVIWGISSLYNLIVPGSDFISGGATFQTLVISAYLVLLCFYQRRYAKTIIRSYLFVSIIVAVIVVSIWIACYVSGSTYNSLRAFFINLEGKTGLSLINIDRRMILGTRYLTVWYRTSPCMTCALGYYLSVRMEGGKKNTIPIILLFFALVFTGTRANIISSMLLVGCYIVFKLHKKGFRLIPLALLSAAMIIVTIIVIRFINDSNSQSSTIKVLDTLTYFDIFSKDAIRTIFFGWGVGSTFFSRGRQMIVDMTENSLLETIRRYGLISTCFIVFGIWFLPFRSGIFIRKRNYLKFFYCCIFGGYMLSALTNPYLLDSVGYCALLFFCIMFTYGSDYWKGNLDTEYSENRQS